MNMSRREFIVKGTALFATLGLGGPFLFSKSGQPLYAEAAGGQEAAPADPTVLVVIQLTGGNDGINTLIPYGLGGYFDARPTLAMREHEVLDVDGKVGLHPSLKGLYSMYEQGRLAIVQGVGYPNPDRSHFRSMDIWQTAEPDKLGRDGWLGRYVASSLSGVHNPLKALQIGNISNKAFDSDEVNVPVIQTLDTFRLVDPKTPSVEQNRIAQAFLDMYDPKRQGVQLQVACRRGVEAYESVAAIQSLGSSYRNKVVYPKTGIGKDLQLVSQILTGQSGTRVFYAQLGGFDDHAQEKQQHAKLLEDLDVAVTAFYADLEEQGLADRVVTLAFSEFGRRVKENGSGGTDHGTAAPVFVMGNKVKGGLYGVYPSLTNVDRNGDLKYEVDFRSVYHTLIDRWLQGDAKSTLAKTYENLGFL
jgi:uncharacterized protein (DUF1501 family)